jgi:hypothetical protein
VPSVHLWTVGFWPGVTHVVSIPSILPQCEGCEYAGCIWIAVVIVVPMVATAADSSSTEKTMILLISNYKDRKYSSSTFYRLFTLFLYVIRDNCQIIS